MAQGESGAREARVVGGEQHLPQNEKHEEETLRSDVKPIAESTAQVVPFFNEVDVPAVPVSLEPAGLMEEKEAAREEETLPAVEAAITAAAPDKQCTDGDDLDGVKLLSAAPTDDDHDHPAASDNFDFCGSSQEPERPLRTDPAAGAAADAYAAGRRSPFLDHVSDNDEVGGILSPMMSRVGGGEGENWDNISEEPESPTLRVVHKIAVEAMRRSFGSAEDDPGIVQQYCCSQRHTAAVVLVVSSADRMIVLIT